MKVSTADSVILDTEVRHLATGSRDVMLMRGGCKKVQLAESSDMAKSSQCQCGLSVSWCK